MLQYEEISDISRLTTGTNAVCWAINHFEEVTIHGFDFFQESKNHYFDGKMMKLAVKSGLKKYDKWNIS